VLTVGGSDRPLINAIRQNTPQWVVSLCRGGTGAGTSVRMVREKVRAGGTRATCPSCGRTFEVELLRRLDDSLGARYAENKDRLLVWIRTRNDSLLAHGLTPVDRERWESSGVPWLGWLRRLLENPAGYGRQSAPAAREAQGP